MVLFYRCADVMNDLARSDARGIDPSYFHGAGFDVLCYPDSQTFAASQKRRDAFLERVHADFLSVPYRRYCQLRRERRFPDAWRTNDHHSEPPRYRASHELI